MTDGWWVPERATCSVWALVQKRRFGGKTKMTRSPHVWWLFRYHWSPDEDAVWPDNGAWYAYVPLTPLKLEDHSRYAVFKHSLWFEGRIKRVR